MPTDAEILGDLREMKKAGTLPSQHDTPDKALACVRAGEDFGWSRHRALASLYVTDEGTIEMSAESMLSLIRERFPGMSLEVLTHTDTECTVLVTRPDDKIPMEVSFTLDDAKKAGLAESEFYRTYPADMMWARCISRVRRRVFPEVATGAHVLGESSPQGAARASDVLDRLGG